MKSFQNLWKAAAGRLRMKLMALNAYVRREERPSTSSVNLHVMKLEEQMKTKVNSKKKESNMTHRFLKPPPRAVIWITWCIRFRVM